MEEQGRNNQTLTHNPLYEVRIDIYLTYNTHAVLEKWFVLHHFYEVRMATSIRYILHKNNSMVIIYSIGNVNTKHTI